MIVPTRHRLPLRIALGAACAALVAFGWLAAPRHSAAQAEPRREIDVDDLRVADGFRIEAVVADLSVPTTAIFDGADLLVAESGFKKTASPRVLRIKPSGAVEVVASAGLRAPVTGLLMAGGRLYVSHLGTVSVVEGGAVRDIVTGLPSLGDHQNNQLVMGRDGKIYMSQGTTTNAGVVGVDNHVFGWLQEHPEVHEVPCKDVVLTGESFETDNPLTEADDRATTGAYKPFGTPGRRGEVIRGNPKCGGSIARFAPDGSGFELVAWGLRNPFGLELDAAGQLWATSHGADVRGSRSIFDDPDYLIRVEPDAWYGWPDYFDGEPVTAGRFDPPAKAEPTMLWAQHPPLAHAFATFDSHAAICGLAFSPGDAFGFGGDAFVAAFGTFAPVTTGVNVRPEGFRVQRVDMRTREVSDFAWNDLPGPAYINQKDGFNRPVDVVFGPDASLYVVDWGATTMTEKGLELVPGTGVVWRIYPERLSALRPGGPVTAPVAALPPAQRQPEVPNIPATYKGVSGTLALLVGAVVLVLVLLIWLWRRLRRKSG